MAKLRQIAFYGKGGIGKSTTSQNTLAALSEATGLRDYRALYSTKEYKKVRVRYFTDEETQWEKEHAS